MSKSGNRELWYQLSCVDDKNLSGESIIAFLELIEPIVKIERVWIDDAIGSFESERFFNGKSFEIRAFKSELKTVTQFDWAFLYINSCQSKHRGGDEEGKLLTDFRNSQIIVRLADDSYFYVYSKNRVYIDAISKVFNQVTVTTNSFDNLDIPY